MTYSAHDLSAQGGDPVLLFLFAQGATEWRYTSAAASVTHASETWSPTPIKIGEVTQSGDLTKDDLKINFNRGQVFAEQFLQASPELITSVTIFRGHLSDGANEFITYWKGRVLGVQGAGAMITVNCEPVFTSLSRLGLRARYQKTCRHALYGSACGLDKDNWDSPETCTATEGSEVTVPAASSMEDGVLIGGMLLYDGITRYISDHEGEDLLLIRAIQSLSDDVDGGPQTVIIYPGCKHNYTTCLTVFDNLDNFGGFPWIPGVNPFGSRSLV